MNSHRLLRKVEDSRFHTLVGLQILSMTYVVLKGYLSKLIDLSKASDRMEWGNDTENVSSSD